MHRRTEVALGFVGLALFGLLFLFSGRFVRIAPVFGMDNILNFHREIGILAFFLVLAHPVTLLIAEPEFLSYFDPSVNLPRALALSFVTVALLVILVKLGRASCSATWYRTVAPR